MPDRSITAQYEKYRAQAEEHHRKVVTSKDPEERRIALFEELSAWSLAADMARCMADTWASKTQECCTRAVGSATEDLASRNPSIKK